MIKKLSLALSVATLLVFSSTLSFADYVVTGTVQDVIYKTNAVKVKVKRTSDGAMYTNTLNTAHTNGMLAVALTAQSSGATVMAQFSTSNGTWDMLAIIGN